MMPKLPIAHRVKVHEVYSVAEAAEVTGTSRETVRRWIKTCGLPATSERPYLIEGAWLKAWLHKRRAANRRPLDPGEIYCLPCRSARRPAGEMAEVAQGRGGQAVLIGICPACDRMMHRFAKPDEIARIADNLDLTFRKGVRRL